MAFWGTRKLDTGAIQRHLGTDSEFILSPPATGHKDVALKEYTLK